METMTNLVVAKEPGAPKTLPPLIFEPMVIHLDDEDSVCSSPVSECGCESPEEPLPSLSGISVDSGEVLQVQPSPLAIILEEYRTALTAEVPSLELCEAYEQAVISYLYYNPATVEDVELLIPEFNIKPYTITGKLASNIGYFHGKGRISEQQVEDIYVALIAQGDPEVNEVFEKVRSAVIHFKRQAEENRASWREYMKQCRQYAGWCSVQQQQQQQALDMWNSAMLGNTQPLAEAQPKKKKKKKSTWVPEPEIDLETLDEWGRVEAQQKGAEKLFRHWKKKYTVRIPVNETRTVVASVTPPSEAEVAKFDDVENGGSWSQTKASSDCLFESEDEVESTGASTRAAAAGVLPSRPSSDQEDHLPSHSYLSGGKAVAAILSDEPSSHLPRGRLSLVVITHLHFAYHFTLGEEAIGHKSSYFIL
ncbi:uncharacterized protein EI97DRAFT_440297 [Westerdykella ornata]|uniref:Uncharacterized protein n=1 Tax=Westerdykella ornata TaxID=318751 RepID=A0A6A6JUR3_WESOR|nr:uncharacterized protein EI97DRAFT_440297 [Westerdykella ornata]KAF2278779.1 hypothetical protein EI97DRAFT_440297 [Westerdykella ornata]